MVEMAVVFSWIIWIMWPVKVDQIYLLMTMIFLKEKQQYNMKMTNKYIAVLDELEKKNMFKNIYHFKGDWTWPYTHTQRRAQPDRCYFTAETASCKIEHMCLYCISTVIGDLWLKDHCKIQDTIPYFSYHSYFRALTAFK